MADREEKSWLLGRSRKFAIIFRGTVDCGFDMRRARITVFKCEKRVEVNLPHCEIQRVWLNLESGDRAGIFAPNLTLDEQNEVVAASLQKIRQKAYQNWDVILKAGVPSDERSDTMNGGGALIIYTAKRAVISPPEKLVQRGKFLSALSSTAVPHIFKPHESIPAFCELLYDFRQCFYSMRCT